MCVRIELVELVEGTSYFSNLCMLCIGRNRVWHVGPNSDPVFEPIGGSKRGYDVYNDRMVQRLKPDTPLTSDDVAAKPCQLEGSPSLSWHVMAISA